MWPSLPEVRVPPPPVKMEGPRVGVAADLFFPQPAVGRVGGRVAIEPLMENGSGDSADHTEEYKLRTPGAEDKGSYNQVHENRSCQQGEVGRCGYPHSPSTMAHETGKTRIKQY